MRKRFVPSVVVLTGLCWGLFVTAGCSGAVSAPDGDAPGVRSLALRAQPIEPPEPPDPPEPAGNGSPDGSGAGEPPTTSATDPGGEGPRSCLCIAVFNPPRECPPGLYFCNEKGSCFCDGSSVSEGEEASSFVQVQSGAGTRAARAAAVALPVTQDPLGCICGFGTATVPSGDCLDQNWYCNISGLCRCAL